MRDTFRIHALAAAKSRKRDKVAASGVVTVIRVNPLIWQKALILSNGDIRRIDVIDSETVIIRNRRIR